jgi:arylsulfatase A-like enzyme
MMWFRFAIVVMLAAITAGASPAPRLVVILCYDQLRGDRLTALEPWLGERGFRRLLRDGAVAPRCYFDYATTVTAAGHATIATGCRPAHHGIVDNDFVIGGRKVYATDDTLLGCPSPRLLLVPALGDYLKRTYPTSKVWSFSHKDRGAIFLGGIQPTGAYWLQPRVGLGSSAYYPAAPAWIEAFNRDHSPTRYAGAIWSATLPPSAPADTVPWEGQFPGGGNIFPHVLVQDIATEQFWRGFALTPFAVEWLFDAAYHCIRAESLGQDDVPDVLCISVSSTDLVGHLFGHDSREYAELLVACDRVLANFLDTLDARVGPDRYLVVLTSDHGAGSIPELEHHRGHNAGRILSDTLAAWVTRWAAQHGGNRRVLAHFFAPWIWLDSSAVLSMGMTLDTAARLLARWLKRQQGIGYAFSRSEIEAGPDTGVVAMIRRSYHPERCGDIVVYPLPRWIFGSTPAQHGTPYDYDRWVPLMFYGADIAAQRIEAACSPTDIVPTLLHILGLEPVPCDGSVVPLRRTATRH